MGVCIVCGYIMCMCGVYDESEKGLRPMVFSVQCDGEQYLTGVA